MVHHACAGLRSVTRGSRECRTFHSDCCPVAVHSRNCMQFFTSIVTAITETTRDTPVKAHYAAGAICTHCPNLISKASQCSAMQRRL